MTTQRPILLSLLSVFVISVGQASAVLIDFDADLPGAPALPSGGDVALDDELAALGVTFSNPTGGPVVWHGPGGTSSFPYSISVDGVGAANDTRGVDPIRVDIDSSITGAFNVVSIRGFDGGGDTDTALLQAFDSSDTLLDSATLSSIFANPGFTLSVMSSNIAYVEFEVTSVTNGVDPGPKGLFWDDLCVGECIEPTPTPEPATILLLGVGLVGLAGIGREKLFKK